MPRSAAALIVCLLLLAPALAGAQPDRARQALEARDHAGWTEQIAQLVASGGSDASQAAEAGALLYDLAREADSEGATTLALEAYRAAIAVAPSARWARHAGTRARQLGAAVDGGASDAEGRELAQIRALLDTDREEALRRATARLTADPSMPPPDRAALLMLAAGELSVRPERMTEAWELYAELALLDGAPLTLQQAAFDRVIFTARGAGRIAETYPLIDSFSAKHELHPLITARARDELLDHRLRQVADLSIYVTFPLFAALFAYRRGWRGLRPAQLREARAWRGAFFIAWIFGFSAVASEIWFHGNLEALLACIPVVIALHVLSIGMGRAGAQPSRALVIAGALIVATTTLSAIYLTMRTYERTAMLGM